MTNPPRVIRIHLTEDDLVPIIQQRGREQGKSVEGQLSHYAYSYARLLLASEELFHLLRRFVNDEERAKERNPLSGTAVSAATMKEANDLIKRISFET